MNEKIGGNCIVVIRPSHIYVPFVLAMSSINPLPTVYTMYSLLHNASKTNFKEEFREGMPKFLSSEGEPDPINATLQVEEIYRRRHIAGVPM